MQTFAAKPAPVHASKRWSVPLAGAAPVAAHRERRELEPRRAFAFAYDLTRIPISPPAPRLMQRKLKINEPGDEFEVEANRVAEMVTRTPGTQPESQCACGGTCSKCRKDRTSPSGLQLKQLRPGALGASEAPPVVHEVLHSPGHPLDTVSRGLMESRFGHDFSRVRVHTGSRAEASAASVNARAMTVGNNIIFAAGEYAPTTPGGRRLLAHELTHVVQQGFGRQHGALQRDQPDSSKQTPKQETSDKPDTPEAAEKAIEDNWKGIVAAATPFDDLKAWTADGDAVVALIRSHTDGALDAIKANNHDVAHAYTVILESDRLMYDFIAWHVVVYANLLALRSGIDGLINAFDHDSDLGFGFHYFRNFKGRDQADAIARGLKKAIDGVPADAKKKLGLIRTDVRIEDAPIPKGSPPIIATGAANPEVRATLKNLTSAMRDFQIKLQGEVEFENQFLDGAFEAGFDQAIDNVEEYLKIKSALKGDRKKNEKTSEEPQPEPVPVPLAPVEGDEDEKKRRPTMRHQIQQGRKHFASLAVTALDDNGVTGTQLRATMAGNFQQYMDIAEGKRRPPTGWEKGPVRWEKPIRSAIIAQSKEIPAIVKAGGVIVGGDINAMRKCFDPNTLDPSTCASNDVRLDVENRGHNLRRE